MNVHCQSSKVVSIVAVKQIPSEAIKSWQPSMLSNNWAYQKEKQNWHRYRYTYNQAANCVKENILLQIMSDFISSIQLYLMAANQTKNSVSRLN